MIEDETTVTPLPLMEITSGVYAFKVLAFADKVGLFIRLSGGGSTTVDDFAQWQGIQHRPAELVLTACAALGLLSRESDGGYRNTALSEQYLVEGKPGYFGAWVKVVDRHEYPAYQRFEDSVRGNHPTTWDPEKQESLFDPDDAVMVETFWNGMNSASAYGAARLAEAVDFSPTTRLLDVGGGGAAFAIALCRRYPRLHVTVFDLPFVCDLTREPVEKADLADRIGFVGGDFFADALPPDHDALLLSNVLHDWKEADVRRILDVCARALPSGGTLLVCESFVDDDKTGPPLAALMSLNMLVETWGRNYTVAEYSQWIHDVRLTVTGVERFAAPAANGVLIARKS